MMCMGHFLFHKALNSVRTEDLSKFEVRKAGEVRHRLNQELAIYVFV